MLSIDSASLLVKHKRETFAQGKVVKYKQYLIQQLASINCRMMIIIISFLPHGIVLVNDNVSNNMNIYHLIVTKESTKEVI